LVLWHGGVFGVAAPSHFGYVGLIDPEENDWYRNIIH
jgi:hypothetical protein